METILPWVMFVGVSIASLVVPVVAVLGVVTYFRRSRQLRDAIGDGSPHAAVSDSLDRVHLRLDAVTDRLTRLEGAVRLGNVTPREVQKPRETGDGLPG